MVKNFVWNPVWPHYVGIFATFFAIVLGLGRYTLLDYMDSYHCGALMDRGSWLDSSRQNWQPDGCMLNAYKSSEASKCFESREVVFVGDSITRKLYFQFSHILDPTLPTSPPDDEHKHTDHLLRTVSGTRLSFYWDPFLNKTRTRHLLSTDIAATYNNSHPSIRPALLVLGSGLWSLRYAITSGGIPAWEANMEDMFTLMSEMHSIPADEVIVLPVEEVIAAKLSKGRADTMHPSDIDAMNSNLYHRISQSSGGYLRLFDDPPLPVPVSLPLVFNQMLDPSETEDGLHFSDSIVKQQANILLNFRCNDRLPKKFPWDKTCCRRYSWPTLIQVIFLGVAGLWGPYSWLSTSANLRIEGLPPVKSEHTSRMVLSVSITLIFLADRTGFWLKENKSFNPYTVSFLLFALVVVGVARVKRADEDLGFLNREQTDEWKGWMQMIILLYHYFGASKIAGIYNAVRVLVAGYLFMTGYGHTTYYLRKADFGFSRVAQVLVRLNLLTILLVYTMDTDYLFYYFSPLVSMWFIIIYTTLAIGAHLNDRALFLISKILLSASLTSLFVKWDWPMETLFNGLNKACAIRWSAREWLFRVRLDIWIVYAGMLTALAVIKAREHRIIDHPRWPLVLKLATSGSVITLLWFFAFELLQESKFTYNIWHPCISFLPVLAFVICRNATVILRSSSSQTFVFIGRCSLETFLIEYHFWLAGDTHGVLLVIPGTRWRSLNLVVTSVMFIFICHHVAQATGEITQWICGDEQRNIDTLPLPVMAEPSSAQDVEPDAGDDIKTPIARRWFIRLTEGAVHHPHSLPVLSKWKEGIGLKSKAALALSMLWVANILSPR